MGIHHGRFVKRFLTILIIICMLGIIGIIGSTSGEIPDDVETAKNSEQNSVTESQSRSTQIEGYLILWDQYTNGPHDGTYGDGDPGDGYNFYLKSQVSSFRIYLKNVCTNCDRLKNVETTLQKGANTGAVITITDGSYSDYTMYPNEVSYFYFDFDIATDAQIKDYALILKVDFIFVDTDYNEFTKSGTIDLKIQLSSRLSIPGSSNELKLDAINKYGAPVPLYSGTKNQIMSFYHLNSAAGSLENVQITLSPPSGFDFDSTIAKIDYLSTSYSYNTDPLWLLDSTADNYEAAGKKYGSLKVNYDYYDIFITERVVPLVIEIEKTPILDVYNQISEAQIGASMDGKLLSNIDIFQSTTQKTFSIKFKNTGNIDLKDVKVELFTDNAAYFYKSNFYYDETDHAHKCTYGNVVFLGDVYKKELKSASFSTAIIKDLPPGLYKIPIKYSGKYAKDDYFDIDLDMGDYHDDIIASRSTNNQGYTPFLIINVIEGEDANDNNEPDLMATSGDPLQPGRHNVLLTVELTNLENYQLNNVNVKISAGGDSPLQQLNIVDRTPVFIDSAERDFVMYAADDPVHMNKQYVHFYVDTYKDATSGTHQVPILVSCYDLFNQKRSSSVNVQLVVNPIPPKFVISETSATEIKPNSDFTLKVKLYNSGGSDAKDVQVMFNGSSNLFSAKQKIKGPVEIDRNEESEFEFLVTANDVEPGNIYTTSVYLSFEDEIGNLYPFDSNSRLIIPLQVKKKEPYWKPAFIILDTAATEIKPNSKFTLTVKVYNSGGSDALNVKVLFNGSTNLFSATEQIQTINAVTKGSDAEFQFEIKAGDVEPGSVYSSSIYLSYEDLDGNLYGFGPNTKQPITLRVKDSEDTWEINEGFALVMLSFFILISAIIIGFVRARTVKKEKKPSVAGETKKPSFWKRKKSNVIDMTNRIPQPQAPSPQQFAPPPPVTPQYPTSTSRGVSYQQSPILQQTVSTTPTYTPQQVTSTGPYQPQSQPGSFQQDLYY